MNSLYDDNFWEFVDTPPRRHLPGTTCKYLGYTVMTTYEQFLLTPPTTYWLPPARLDRVGWMSYLPSGSNHLAR